MRRLGLLLVASVMVVGCKGKEAPQAAPEAAPVAAVKVDPATLGEVSGTVRFTGKVPAPVKIDTSMDPACGMSGAPEFSSEQYVVRDGKLANVYVYVKSGPASAMRASPVASAPVVMDQKGCRYTPHVIAVARGGTVSFANSDVTMHNIHTMPTTVGNEAIDVSQGPKGAPVVKRFGEAETMIPVRCNNHPWMNAFINVSPTPFFGVTYGAGHFEVNGMPAGDYELGFVHEKLGEQTVKVTVAAASKVTADVVFAMK